MVRIRFLRLGMGLVSGLKLRIGLGFGQSSLYEYSGGNGQISH